MGVFTVSKQFRMGLNLIPPWWLSGASIDLDFRNNRAYDSSLATGQQPLAQLSSYLSCTRASTGYAKNSAGNLVSFGNNALRQTDLGLLIEDARTNNALSSQDLTNTTYWLQGNGLTVVGGFSAPDGSATAFKLTSSSLTNCALLHKSSNSIAGTSGTVYVGSAYVKAGVGGPFVLVQVMDSGGSNGAYLYLNVATGVTGTAAVIGDATLDGSGIEPLANGWYRLWIACHFATNRTIGFDLYSPVIADGNINNNAGDYCYYWGPQLETGAFPTSYIPTTSASVTRAQDSVIATGSLKTMLTAAPQSAFSDFILVPGYAFTPSRRIVGWETPTGGALIESGGDTQVLTETTTSLVATLGSGLVSTGVKIAVGYSGAGRSIVANNGSVATDSSAFPTVTNIKLGAQYDGTQATYGYHRRFAAWNSRLSDAALAALTV